MLLVRLLLLVSFGSLSASVARADVVGVGLDFRKNVFVQEVWESGEPSYVIYNKQDKPVSITVLSRRTKEKLAGPWAVNAGSMEHVAAKDLIGKDLMEFQLGDGTSLGLLDAPVKANWNADGDKEIRSSHGMNGSGGRQADIWVRQPIRVKSGTAYTIDVSAPANAGLLMWSKKIDGLVSVESPTLTVKTVADRYEVDLSSPKQKADRHTITLTMKHPDYKATSMFMLDGWRWTSAKKTGGHGITRLIVVDAKPQ